MLVDYFKDPLYKDALAGYAKFARERDWGIDNKLELYNWAKVAFDSSLPERNRREAFYIVYDNLKGNRQVFRNARWGYWTGDETFEVLDRECQGCSRQDSLSLLTLQHPSQESDILLAILNKLRNLKPARGYPWMPVAKFTHFFNPKLFPIYDNEVIWKMVMDGVFRDDYRSWCHSKNLNPIGPGERFNLNYMLWAGHIIHQADNGLMGYFREWFKSQVAGRPDSHNVLVEIQTYYATVFEFVAIGAANLELPDLSKH